MNWVIYLLYLKSGKICCTTRTAVFFKTNHLKQRTGLDICGECVGLRIPPPSFQVNLDHHHLDRYQFTRDRKYYFLIVKTWLLPHSGSDQSTLGFTRTFDCQVAFLVISPTTGCWLRCLVLLFSQSIIAGSRRVAFRTHFMQQLLLVFILPGLLAMSKVVWFPAPMCQMELA